MVRVQVLYEYCVTRCLISLAAHVPVAWKLDSAIRTINSQEHHLTSVLRDATPPIRLLVAFQQSLVCCLSARRTSQSSSRSQRTGWCRRWAPWSRPPARRKRGSRSSQSARSRSHPATTGFDRARLSGGLCVCVWHVVAPVKDKESFCAPPAARRTAPCPSRRCAGCRSRRAASRRRPTS